jgi:uncharacterized oxidoreductase
MQIQAQALNTLIRSIFTAAGSQAGEAEAIADHLVDSNLAGHDSHGVIRVRKYIEWARAGMVVANRQVQIVVDSGPVLVVDGQFGYGQVIGKQGMALGIARAQRDGLALLGIRNTAHLGRIGAWAEQAAAAGLVSFSFVNTSGFGILVAPHGGSDRRLSANPIAAGAPRANGPPIILDMSTCIIAAGKIDVARNKGTLVGDDMLLDGSGQPTRDPNVFYATPPGAILPIGGHKGYGLSMFCELLAGSLTGGRSSHPNNPTADRLVNNMFSLLIAPEKLSGAAPFADDVERLVAWVQASPPLHANGEVLIPGDPERRSRAERLAKGIPLDDNTLKQIADSAVAVGLAAPDWSHFQVAA